VSGWLVLGGLVLLLGAGLGAAGLGWGVGWGLAYIWGWWFWLCLGSALLLCWLACLVRLSLLALGAAGLGLSSGGWVGGVLLGSGLVGGGCAVCCRLLYLLVCAGFCLLGACCCPWLVWDLVLGAGPGGLASAAAGGDLCWAGLLGGGGRAAWSGGLSLAAGCCLGLVGGAGLLSGAGAGCWGWLGLAWGGCFCLGAKKKEEKKWGLWGRWLGMGAAAVAAGGLLWAGAALGLGSAGWLGCCAAGL